MAHVDGCPKFGWLKRLKGSAGRSRPSIKICRYVRSLSSIAMIDGVCRILLKASAAFAAVGPSGKHK
jgi:hypothetical protein